jgi:hypothetical protein
MCKVCFDEQHQHTIAIAIARAKVMEGGGAEAPCKEKAVAVMPQFIADSLDNNVVRERQHCDGRGEEEGVSGRGVKDGTRAVLRLSFRLVGR